MAFEGERGRMFGRLESDLQEKREAARKAALDKKFDKEVMIPLKDDAVDIDDLVEAGAVTKAEAAEDTKKIEAFKQSEEYDRVGVREAKVLEFALQKMFDDGIFGDVVKYTKKTADYDDIVRGIDFYVDIGEGEERVLLGIDATASVNIERLKEKVERNVSAAERGQLPAVKYFVDIDSGSHREMEMPRVILGMDRETVRELQTELLEKPGTLENSEIVLLLIEQMLGQLELAKNAAPSGSKAKEACARAMERVLEICKEKDLDPGELRQAFRHDALANPNLRAA